MPITIPAIPNPDDVRFDRGIDPVILFEIADEALYFSNRSITAGSSNDFSNSYDGAVSPGGLGTVTQSVPFEGGMGSSGNITISVVNQNNTSNFLATYNYPENDEVKIYVVFDDTSDLMYAEKCLLFTGRIYELTFDTIELTMVINDGKKKFDKDIPLTKVNAGAYPNAHSQAIGKPIQVVFGDFADTAYHNGSKLTTWRPNMPGIPMSALVDVTSKKFLISDHTLHTFDADRTMVYLSDYDRFAVVTGETRTATAPTSVHFSSTVQMEFIIRPTERHVGDPEDIAIYTSAIDDDPTTATLVDNFEELFLKPKNGDVQATWENVGATDIFLTIVIGSVLSGSWATVYRVTGLTPTRWELWDLSSSPKIEEGDANSTKVYYWTAGATPTTWEEFLENGWGISCPSDTKVDIIDMYITVQGLEISLTEYKDQKIPYGVLTRKSERQWFKL